MRYLLVQSKWRPKWRLGRRRVLILQLVLGSSVEVDNADVRSLYDLTAVLLGGPISRLQVVACPWRGINVGQGLMFLFIIDPARWVAIKACRNTPAYLDAEVRIAALRKQFGMPHYAVSSAEAFRFRRSGTEQNVHPFEGWEHNPVLLIDCGLPDRRQSIGQMQERGDSFPDPMRSMKQLGEWFAFNTILAVSDRHRWNFMFDQETGLLLSIDNEETAEENDFQFGNYREIGKLLTGGLGQVQLDLCRNEFNISFRTKWAEILARRQVIDGMTECLIKERGRHRLEEVNPELILQELWQ